MEQTPYAAPQSELDKPQKIEIPEEITKKIKGAVIAGIVSITMTVILTLVSIYGTSVMGLDATAFIDAALMAAFTFGTYKKSRVCAALMLLLFVANKLIMWTSSGNVAGLPLAAVFAWFYLQGLIGTVKYHQLVKAQTT
ncbi:hypothetical protein [Microbulbifer hainanensis]|uniref:hypothetical protein n=1 Tax=Microbulbifer hainanensis TaxID=2735675 RepID=UPI0018673F2C|nr:hypothetical protein [Microbulbifer hainanensis]